MPKVHLKRQTCLIDRTSRTIFQNPAVTPRTEHTGKSQFFKEIFPEYAVPISHKSAGDAYCSDHSLNFPFSFAYISITGSAKKHIPGL